MRDSQLPKRLFHHGHEPAKDKVNVYSFNKYYRAVMNFLDKNSEQKKILFKSQFGKLIKEGFKVSTSAQFLHYLLFRQLVTTSGNEIWILFGGKLFRFSIPEFVVATGLNCNSPPVNFEEDRPEEEEVVGEEGLEPDVGEEEAGDTSNGVPYWPELFEEKFQISRAQICDKLNSKKLDVMKRLNLSCLLLVDVILLLSSIDAKIIDSHLEMIRDLDVFLQHPWGSESFAFTMKSIKSKTPAAMCQQTMAIQGFIHGLQLVALSCIPEIVEFATAIADNLKKEIVLNTELEEISNDEELSRALKIIIKK